MSLDLGLENRQAERSRPQDLSCTTGREDLQSISHVQHYVGNLAMQSLFRSGLLQPKLTVGSTDDPAEREADAVAAQIMGSSAERKGLSSLILEGSSVQDHLFRQNAPSSVPGIVEQVLHSAGRPLDPATRAFFEPRLGVNLGNIRVHTDQEAADSAQSIRALAYTSGPAIAFARGRYSPQTEEGKHLLAHELVHTVQQSSPGSSVVRRTPDLGGLNINVFHDGTNVPISGAAVHIDQKLVSSSKSVDLVTDSQGNTPYIQLEEGNYTVTVTYKCCQKVQDVHIVGNSDQMTFFPFGLCNCGIASTDQDGGGGGASDSDATA